MLEFYNYHYLHEKYAINHSCRDSQIFDPLSELEKHLEEEWEFEYKDIFAIAKAINSKLNFNHINREVVDENHLSLEDLLVFLKEKTFSIIIADPMKKELYLVE